MSSFIVSHDGLSDPIQLVAELAAQHNWSMQIVTPHRLGLAIDGGWGHYALSVRWQDTLEVLTFDVAFDLMLKGDDGAAIGDLLTILNRDIFLGHFQLAENEDSILLKYRLPLRGTGGASVQQLEDIIDIMLGQCEQAAPSISQLLFSDTPHVLDSAVLVMMEPCGRA